METSLKYILIPFIAWILCGSIKFTINFFRAGFEIESARNLIGYGGFPSTHTTVVSTAVFLIGIEHGFDSSIFSLGLSLLIVVVMDAHGLRRNVGKHAERLNLLAEKFPNEFPNEKNIPLRERMGHSYFEIAGGLLLGFFIANLASRF